MLRVEHPVTKALLTFTAPLPSHMRRTWDLLGWDQRDAPPDPFEPEDAP
jgi:23S rRNA pseudouridine955/2504/2580 synthase